jgi:branched-chain amino acid transport system substrate-binding protein
MISAKLVENFGSDLDGSSGQVPGTDSAGAGIFAAMAGDDFDGTSPFAAESYDATALIMLAMQAAGSSDPAAYKEKVMEVANAPGLKIEPGQLGLALQAVAAGIDIDYVGATAVELIGGGESAGNYRQVGYDGGAEITVKYR